jgi:hypothetical protein
MVALSLSAGCSRKSPQSEYQAFGGTVRAIDVASGELFVRADERVRGWRPNRDVPCVVTKDTEVYLNDRFVQLADVWVGDQVELVGYRDADHLVLSLLTVTRSQPKPPPPALPPQATQPASAPEE